MRTRKKVWRKRPHNIDQYFAQAIAAGKTQEDMAKDWGVQRNTIRNWLKSCGYEFVVTYRKRREAA